MSCRCLTTCCRPPLVFPLNPLLGAVIVLLDEHEDGANAGEPGDQERLGKPQTGDAAGDCCGNEPVLDPGHRAHLFLQAELRHVVGGGLHVRR
jgi:hypothetical protein